MLGDLEVQHRADQAGAKHRRTKRHAPKYDARASSGRGELEVATRALVGRRALHRTPDSGPRIRHSGESTTDGPRFFEQQPPGTSIESSESPPVPSDCRS